VEAASFFPGGEIFCPPTLHSFSPLSQFSGDFSHRWGVCIRMSVSNAAAQLLLLLVALLIAALGNVSINRMSADILAESNGPE
jgi:hypothetical protein